MSGFPDLPANPWYGGIQAWTKRVSDWAWVVEQTVFPGPPPPTQGPSWPTPHPHPATPAGRTRLKEWAALMSKWALSVERQKWPEASKESDWQSQFTEWTRSMKKWDDTL